MNTYAKTPGGGSPRRNILGVPLPRVASAIQHSDALSLHPACFSSFLELTSHPRRAPAALPLFAHTLQTRQGDTM